jgi:hypothetical protein
MQLLMPCCGRKDLQAYDVIKTLSAACYGFWSTERPGTKASGSEMKRWIKSGAVLINGKRVGLADEVGEVEEIILFPRSGRRTTWRF